jgi:hypothetical protein
MSRRQVVQMVAAALVAVLVLGGVASAAPEHGRGNIVSVNMDRLTMQIKHPSGSIGTWKFNRNAAVKFIDGAAFFPNPSTKDLREPMYVAFVFENEVIDSFEVRELGFTPGREESTSTRKEQGTPRTVTGKLTAYDTNVMQIEMESNGVRETFQLVSSVPMRGLAAGQQVRVRTEWSGQQELVHELTILGRR